MHSDARRSLLALVATLLVGGLALAPGSGAQDNPILDLFTTTTTPTSTTRPGSTSTTPAPPTAPEGAEDVNGDGVAAPSGGIEVPPEAQRIIDAVKRTRPSSSEGLVAALSGLTALGMDPAEAMRVGMGRFPVAGVARYSHDWLLPRYGPGFRFHLGCDVVADLGTPVRSPVDGIVTSHRDSLGGLTARVTMPDRTAFAFAHLAELAADFTEGGPVRTGDIVGYVGDSGNARGGTPHVHVAVYPKGGKATDPKPILDRFLQEAEAALPAVIAEYAGSGAVPTALLVPLLPVPADARLLRPTLATRALHGWTSGGDAWTPTALYVLANDPSAGAAYLLQSTLDALAATIDWSAR